MNIWMRPARAAEPGEPTRRVQWAEPVKRAKAGSGRCFGGALVMAMSLGFVLALAGCGGGGGDSHSAVDDSGSRPDQDAKPGISGGAIDYGSYRDLPYDLQKVYYTLSSKGQTLYSSIEHEHYVNGVPSRAYTRLSRTHLHFDLSKYPRGEVIEHRSAQFDGEPTADLTRDYWMRGGFGMLWVVTFPMPDHPDTPIPHVEFLNDPAKSEAIAKELKAHPVIRYEGPVFGWPKSGPYSRIGQSELRLTMASDKPTLEGTLTGFDGLWSLGSAGIKDPGVATLRLRPTALEPIQYADGRPVAMGVFGGKVGVERADGAKDEDKYVWFAELGALDAREVYGRVAPADPGEAVPENERPYYGLVTFIAGRQNDEPAK